MRKRRIEKFTAVGVWATLLALLIVIGASLRHEPSPVAQDDFCAPNIASDLEVRTVTFFNAGSRVSMRTARDCTRVAVPEVPLKNASY